MQDPSPGAAGHHTSKSAQRALPMLWLGYVSTASSSAGRSRPDGRQVCPRKSVREELHSAVLSRSARCQVSSAAKGRRAGPAGGFSCPSPPWKHSVAPCHRTLSPQP